MGESGGAIWTLGVIVASILLSLAVVRHLILVRLRSRLEPLAIHQLHVLTTPVERVQIYRWTEYRLDARFDLAGHPARSIPTQMFLKGERAFEDQKAAMQAAATLQQVTQGFFDPVESRGYLMNDASPSYLAGQRGLFASAILVLSILGLLKWMIDGPCCA